MQNVSPATSLVAVPAERPGHTWGPATSRHRSTWSRSKIAHQLYFHGESRVWGGSPAFIDTVPVDGLAGLARAYLIGWDQFEDVVAQENGRPSTSIEIADRGLGARLLSADWVRAI